MYRWELHVKFKGSIKYEFLDAFKALTSCIDCINELKDSKTGTLKLIDKTNDKEILF